ncbi:MAG TPA: hypothetical protein VL742_02260 [Casimicrobiaceae bacterium]|nr:hypothetical protein [Casimicrobiaceae bacterium]
MSAVSASDSYGGIGIAPIARPFARAHLVWLAIHIRGDQAMGKYVLAWLLGVPAVVLVIIYFFFH